MKGFLFQSHHFWGVFGELRFWDFRFGWKPPRCWLKHVWADGSRSAPWLQPLKKIGGALQGGPLLVINGADNPYKRPYKLVIGVITLLIRRWNCFECFKVLVLVEMASNSVSYSLGTKDLQQTRAEIAKWLEGISEWTLQWGGWVNMQEGSGVFFVLEIVYTLQ